MTVALSDPEYFDYRFLKEGLFEFPQKFDRVLIFITNFSLLFTGCNITFSDFTSSIDICIVLTS